MAERIKPDRPVVLIVMDGWGLREEVAYNAVALATTPNYDELMSNFPSCRLQASGEDVGLPSGLMGNSEVGHLNLGAGRIVSQQLIQINQSIESGEFRRNKAFMEAVRLARSRKVRVHLCGLVSEASVHSSERHYMELINLLEEEGLAGRSLVFHAFTDGRDSAPDSGLRVVSILEARLAEVGALLGTVIGRYYGMDRDKHWVRTRMAYEAMVFGLAPFSALSGVDAIEKAYKRAEIHDSKLPFPAETDEFIRPTVIVGADGLPVGRIQEQDVVISFNHRADRPRQIIRALVEDDFKEIIISDSNHCEFPDNRPDIDLVTMTDYGAGLCCPVAFRSNPLTSTLSEIVSLAGRRQFHIAETEKYPHVTFFFNGRCEESFSGECRYIAQSPSVATYDQKPEMSAREVTDRLVGTIQKGHTSLFIVNYANGDMVGHSGILAAAIKAVETVDEMIGEVVKETLEVEGTVLITADHGNCEQMWDEENQIPHTAHTTNPVPCILVSTFEGAFLRNGRLADIAPTILEILELPKPEEMDGKSLIVWPD